jgi:arylsulfatase A-like enzyme/Tfp pilus assembly protein PilF
MPYINPKSKIENPKSKRLQASAFLIAFLWVNRAVRAETRPVNVILVTIDTLRADHVGCYGNRSVPTSTMDRLARDGVVFRRAIAQVPLTLPSHVAILTGTYPMWNGVADLTTAGLGPGIPTLAEVFKKHGYSTAALVSAFVLNSMWGLNRGFDFYDDAMNPQQDDEGKQHPHLERRASATVDHTLRWLQGHSSQPFFLWLHLYDPHAPYDPAEPFKSRFRTHPYDGEIAYTDEQLGRFVSFLEVHNLYASSLILLVSDHGEGLGEHGEQQHGLFIYNSTVHVPLILKLPAGFKSAQRSINQVVNTVDIAPTLTQYCRFPSTNSASFQGRSLLPLLESASLGAPRQGYSESLYPRSSFGWHSLHGTENEEYHYIRAPREELYDLRQDPAETRNILEQNLALAATLRESMQALVVRYARKAEPSQAAPAMELEKLRELRSLGYVGGSSARSLEGDASGAPDPKDRVGFCNRVIRATELAEDGRWRESNALLEQAAAEDPKAYLPPFLMGENALAERRYHDAVDHYRHALELNPRYDLAAMGMGQAALYGGDPAGAVKAFQQALDLNPRNYLVKLAMARAYEMLNRLADAARLEKEALASHPQDGKAKSDYGVTLVRMKQYQEGLAALQEAVQLGYRTAITYNFLGTARLAVGNTEEAVQAYEESIRLDAKYSAPYGNLALLYLREGQNEKARLYYAKACQSDSVLCRDLASRFR